MKAYSFTILTFILIDIQNSFSVDRALARALGAVTLLHEIRRRSPRGDRGRLVGEAGGPIRQLTDGKASEIDPE